MTAHLKYALLGVALSVGSPAGMLLLRVLGAGGGCWRRLDSYTAELRREPLTYGYLTGTTALAFAAFGRKLGAVADALQQSSTTDALTGLHNARAFTERLHQAVSQAARYREALSVLIVDVDRLKNINDTYGHQAGSACLRSVADALRTTLRAADSGFRWGGDEFAILAPHTTPAEAALIGQRLLMEISRAATSAPGLSVSVGAASLVPDPHDVAASCDIVVARADAALYRAKRDGRSCLRSAGPSRSASPG